MYRLIKDDEGRIKWRIEVEFDALFEGDTGTFNSLEDDLAYYFQHIAQGVKHKKIPCPQCGYEMNLGREYLDGEETGNWYEICDQCGYAEFGEHELAKLERKYEEKEY